MSKPASVLSSDTFATWRTRYNTLRDQVPEVVESANAPTVNDDITNYENGTLWVRSNGDCYILADNTNGAAVWTLLGSTPGALINDGSVPLTANWDVGGFDITNIDQVVVNTGILSNDNAGSLRISGGASSGAGAEILLYGSTVSDMGFYAANALELFYDHSASTWDFQANAIATTGALSCGLLTSAGIDDNATNGEMLDLSNSSSWFVTLSGNAAGAVYLRRGVDDGSLQIRGGSTATATDSSIILYGGTHANAGDVLFRYNNGNTLAFDRSAGSWNFQANDIITTGNIDGDTITATTGFSGPGGSITGVNAAQLNGYASATTASANTIARRDASGDLAVVALTATGGGTFGTASPSWIGEYGIYLEDEKHTISVNDGFGNFNIRVGHNPLGATYGDERCTEAGYISHLEFTQSTGVWDFQVSSASLSLGGTPTWRSMVTIDPTDVTLAYQGSTKLATVSNGVSITGNITADNIGSIASKDFWSGTQASYDGIGTPDANTIYFITE